MVYPEKLVSLVFALMVLLVTQGPVLAATGNVPATGKQAAPPAGGFGSPGTAEVFTYDANGNLVNGNGFAYVYDDANHLSEVRFALNNTLIATYDYDMAGNRVRKVIGNVTTYYLGNLVETRAQDALLKNTSYYFANTERVARQDPDGKKYYYHGDHLGSTSIVTNATGAVVESVAYLPYGETQSRTGSGSTYLYTDQELDPESSLYYYGARYYSPELMRFVETDPMIQDVYNPQNLNRYSYVLNNPILYTDPTGQVKRMTGGEITCIIGGGRQVYTDTDTGEEVKADTEVIQPGAAFYATASSVRELPQKDWVDVKIGLSLEVGGAWFDFSFEDGNLVGVSPQVTGGAGILGFTLGSDNFGPIQYSAEAGADVWVLFKYEKGSLVRDEKYKPPTWEEMKRSEQFRQDIEKQMKNYPKRDDGTQENWGMGSVGQ